MSLEKTLKSRIHEEGAISVHDYMAACLRQYYATRDPLGIDGDFITAPEISQIFGEMVGVWAASLWQEIGAPECDLMELGPGRGTLMSDALRATKNLTGFHPTLHVHMVETSPSLRQKQQQTLALYPNISWHTHIPDNPRPLLLIANEFFDALPIRQFQDGKERMIGLENDCFFFINEGTNAEKIEETCPQAQEIITQIAKRIKRFGGGALIIDYGYSQGEKGDTLQAVKNHHPHDPLQQAGEADLTAHVDFLALAGTAQRCGIKTLIITQAEFLSRMGGKTRLERLCTNAEPKTQTALKEAYARLTQEMGTLFKVLILQR